MAFTSRLNTSLFNCFVKYRHYHKIKLKKYKPQLPKILPTTIGFSIFTWLGFDEKLISSPEDEIIKTIKYSILFIQRNEYDKAERLLHVALRQAQQIQHTLGITYIYDVMANLALQRKHLDKAKTLFVEVTQRLMAGGATEDDLRVVQISVKLARICHLKNEFELAQTGYDWCLKKLKSLIENNPTKDAKVILALAEDWYGRLFVDCKNVENGLKLMNVALNRMKSIEIEEGHIATQLNDMGVICEQFNKIDESIDYFKEAIEHYNVEEDKEDLGVAYVNLGKSYIRKKMIEEARKYCGKGFKLGQETDNPEIKKEAKACFISIKENT